MAVGDNLDLLQDAGQTGAVRSIEWGVITADFGDGFYKAAIVGIDGGTWTWTLNWNAVSRNGPPIQRKSKLGAPIGGPIPRGRYLLDLHAICMSQGNQPFWFVDFGRPIPERTATMVRFVSPIFTMQQSGVDRMIYSYSVDIKQVRGWVG